ncbi:endonuclease/exonuclease/phosphatase family protein (plasmid) [Streptosporangium sp. NBC_01495]|uniref:endonuclease/exonuclease/phosphatase family protein n=1 Tax=Streptosporangium sp. NBC_01495 TaxID=2903899 RepID=UPI002E2FCA91|nr:endonuclease/exonuclease/phosphatase family protein [Streptosporangium sp. NBC_01495]
MDLKVGTYNLRDGGIDNGVDARLGLQLEMLKNQGFDVLALLEAKRWNRDRRRLLYRAEAALNMRATLVKSSHHGCHLVLCVNTDRVQIVDDRHERGHPYWHGVVGHRIVVDGRVEADVVAVHQAPSSPQIRLAEAESLQLVAKAAAGRPLVLMGDFNAVPSNHIGTSGSARKRDRRPALALEEKLFDVGAVWGDHTPTVGHEPGSMAYRADRIYTNLLPEAVIDYAVVPEEAPLSDHLLVRATFSLGSGAA